MTSGQETDWAYSLMPTVCSGLNKTAFKLTGKAVIVCRYNKNLIQNVA